MLTAGSLAAAAAPPATPATSTRGCNASTPDLRSYQADLHVDVHDARLPAAQPLARRQSLLPAARQERDRVQHGAHRSRSSSRKSTRSSSRRRSGPSSTTSPRSPTTGRRSQFRLVRKKNGRIDHVDVTVDDRTATVTSMAYFYKDGGSVSFQQTYAVDRRQLRVARRRPAKSTCRQYNADVASTFSNYKLNVTIDQRVFSTGLTGCEPRPYMRSLRWTADDRPDRAAEDRGWPTPSTGRSPTCASR